MTSAVFEFTVATPAPRSGYSAIAEKAFTNTALSVTHLVAVPFACGIGAFTCCIGAITCLTGAAAFGAAAVVSTAMGVIGLAAVPVIAAKDLAHHSFRVIFTDPQKR